MCHTAAVDSAGMMGTTDAPGTVLIRPVRAAFNDGAERFHRRPGFTAVPGSEPARNGIIPQVAMRRRPDERARG